MAGTQIAELFASFEIVAKSIEAPMKAISTIKTAALGLIAVTAAKRMFEWVEEASHSATEMIAFANATGLGVQATREWTYVTQAGGGSARSFAVGIGMLESQVKQFANGTHSKLIIGRMHQLGVTTKEQAKQITSTSETFDKFLGHVSDTFTKMRNTPDRGVLARGIFGAKSARDVTADMARGSAGIATMRQRYRELAGTMTDEQAMKLRDTGIQIKNLGIAWDSIKMHVVAAIGPSLLAILEGATKWLTEHGDQIKDTFTTVFGAIGYALAPLVPLLKAAAWAVETLVHALDVITGGHADIALAIMGWAFAIYKVREAMMRTYAMARLVWGPDMLAKIGSMGKTVLGIIPAIGELAAATWAAVAPTLALLAPWLAVAAAIAGAIYLIQGMSEMMDTSHEEKLENVANQDQSPAAVKKRAKEREADGSHQKLLDALDTPAAKQLANAHATATAQATSHVIHRASITNAHADTKHETTHKITNVGGIKIEIKGAHDPAATAAAVDDAMQKQLRHAASAFGADGT